MSADFNNPTVDDQYTEILPQIRDNQSANAVMFNGVTVSNTPMNAVQFVSGQFNLWDGAAWNVQPVSIAGGGTGGMTASEARANLGVNSTAESNSAYLKVTSNGSDIDDISIFRTEINVYSKTETYTQSEVDAKTIINNTLTSTSTTESLAAAQGKVLKDLVDANTNAINNLPSRAPITVWTGSSTDVTSANILSSSGHVVQAGNYALIDFLGSTIATIISPSLDGNGCARGADGWAVWLSSSQKFRLQYNGTTAGTMVEIKYYPL